MCSRVNSDWHLWTATFGLAGADGSGSAEEWRIIARPLLASSHCTLTQQISRDRETIWIEMQSNEDRFSSTTYYASETPPYDSHRAWHTKDSNTRPYHTTRQRRSCRPMQLDVRIRLLNSQYREWCKDRDHPLYDALHAPVPDHAIKRTALGSTYATRVYGCDREVEGAR